jgi:hypothetical protein
MKTITIIFLCNFISINFINAQKCYVCDQNGCDRPGPGNIKDCFDGDYTGTSGKPFLNGVYNKVNDTNIYTTIESELNTFVSQIGVNQSAVSWKSLTQWVNFL